MGVRFEFAAELENMDVDRTVEAVKIMAERFFDDFRPTEHPARLFNESPQDFKLDGGEV